jgi:hypothetical protein
MNTAADIQSWIDNYRFVDNGTASKDILFQIVGKFPNHSFQYGPTESGGYYLNIAGPTITHDFTVK